MDLSRSVTDTTTQAFEVFHLLRTGIISKYYFEQRPPEFLSSQWDKGERILNTKNELKLMVKLNQIKSRTRTLILDGNKVTDKINVFVKPDDYGPESLYIQKEAPQVKYGG